MGEPSADDRLFPDAADKLFDSITAQPGMSHGYILLAALTVAFVVYCDWLRGRISKRQERWAKRMAVATGIGALVLYPLSIGPAMWLRLSGYTQEWMKPVIWTIYEPILFVGGIMPPVGKLLWVYLELWTG
jgi:hypothetical protein